MREELLKLLKIKLDDIKINIESLNDLNGKITKAENDLAYAKGMVEKFSDGSDAYNVLNFNKFSKDEFENVLSIVRSDVRDIFSTNNCNYDGLIYLINGIKNGVSLSLTIEQENAINYFIQSLEDVVRHDMAVVDGLYLVKTRFAISDVDVLEDKKEKYDDIVKKINGNKYVDDVDDIREAMEFSGIDLEETSSILTFLLKYNADIYNEEKEKHVDEHVEEKIELQENDEKTKNDFVETSVEKEDIKVEPITFDNEIEEDKKEDIEFHLPEFNKIEENTVSEYNIPFVPEISNEEEKEETKETEKNEENEELKSEDIIVPTIESEEDKIDDDFGDIVPQDDYDEYNDMEKTISITPVADEKTSTREVQRLFQEYNVNVSDDELNDYVNGNIEEYRKIILLLKENGVLNIVTSNKELFKEMILNSDESSVSHVLNIIENDLSVDSEDYETTLKIAIATIPSIFGKNSDNFIQNVKLFKELGINLVGLFDFSKEVLIASHDHIVANYDIVKEYNISIDDKNAKYFLLLNDIAERIDYYVESVYKDEIKDDTFDGYKFIQSYPNKLNCVTDETIKRLRYSSSNGKKVFGSKPNSLAGEITNLKVNVLDISDEYLNNFFDNGFDDISYEEVRQYAKLCKNSSNVGDYADELSILEKYRDNIRYDINGVKVSYNKVLRNYNTLRSYGVDKKKAREFAVCYNLVITKDEYHDLKETLNKGVDE